MKKKFWCVVVVLCCGPWLGCGSGTNSSEEFCTLNSDCSDPAATCVGNVCRVDCRQDRDCGAGELCEMSVCISGAVPCRSDQDCTFNQECIQGVCAEIDGFCERNRDCPEDQACSGRTYRCIDVDGFGGDCNDDRDCFAEEICIQGRCEGRTQNECVRNSDCRSGELCLEGRCEPECVQDRDCPTGQLCDDGRCEDDPNFDPNNDPNNNPGPVCGNNVCENGENTANCPQDCPPPQNCTQNPALCTANQECCEGACVPRGQCGPSDYWSVCAARAECSSELCLGDPNTGIGHCTERCTVRSDCPQGPVSLCIGPQQFVTNQPGGNELIGLCFADDTGTPCSPLGANTCFDGICLDRRPNNQVEGQCSLRCRTAADCLGGYACGPKEFNVDGAPQLINVCVPIGSPCQGQGVDAANQCYSGVCLTDENNQGACSTVCLSDASCPVGWACTPIDQTNSVCLPR